MYILGINSVYHESSACLIKDGRIIAAVEEERLSGIKHAKRALLTNPHELPYLSINYCLVEASKIDGRKITLNDLDYIGYSFDPSARLSGNITEFSNSTSEKISERISEELIFFYLNQQVPRCLTEEVNSSVLRSYKEINGYPSRIEDCKFKFLFIPHHLCHAASAFFVSPFDRAAILTVDGIGERTTTWAGIGEGSQMKELFKLEYPNSLGFLYERITEFLGFQKNSDEYKVTGLAAYGDSDRYYNEFKRIVSLEPEGRFSINNEFTKFRLPLYESRLEEFFGSPRRYHDDLEWDMQSGKTRHADIAAGLQRITEEVMMHLANHLFKLTDCKHLCLAGGVALNCLVNSRIKEQTPFENIFIQPAAHDAGTAVGAAFYIYHEILGNPKSWVMETTALGPCYSDRDIKRILDNLRIPYKELADNEQIAEKCAQLLCQGKIIGWFQGRSEFGPRALGNRSILANPTSKDIQSLLNRIKGREIFRPFAPSVLEEEANTFFKDFFPSPFMLFAFETCKEKRKLIPAAIHVDGTSRVQSVNKNLSPLYHKVIKNFADLTEKEKGFRIPLIVNTSFNMKSQPIICSPKEALKTFYTSNLHTLLIGRYMVEKA